MDHNAKVSGQSELVSNDANLWALFKSGDRKSFQTIYLRYLNPLFNYGYKISPNRNLVKDCIQDLFIELWKNKNGLSQTDKIKPYLYKALRRKIVKEVATTRKKANQNYGESQADIIMPFEDQIIENETLIIKHQRLRTALEKLSPRQKEVISLIFYEELSFEEVSKIMGINLRSVYTLSWKAISSLQKWLLAILAWCCWTGY